MKAYLTTGIVRDGRLTVRKGPAFVAAMQQFKDGEVLIEIRRAHAIRSLAQNAWYWSVILAVLSDETGYTAEELHEYCKQRFLPKRLALADRNGEVKDDVVIGGTTTTLNKLEFGEYCEAIRQWAAADLGLNIPSPGEVAA